MKLSITQQIRAIENSKKNLGWRHLFKVLVEIQQNQQEQNKLLKTLNTNLKAKRFNVYLPKADDSVNTAASPDDHSVAEGGENALTKENKTNEA